MEKLSAGDYMEEAWRTRKDVMIVIAAVYTHS